MCGLAGFWQLNSRGCTSDTQVTIRSMINALVHRGPNDSGIWCKDNIGIALGHRRLSILDLSPLGHQPMISSNERYVLVFNGEIYNFLELRRELENLGHCFRGDSDTEVMLESFIAWGVDGAVTRFRGMFAFALWDQQECVLHLGRDRLGEKPLYYGWLQHTFVFASELKALTQHPEWRGEINRDSLALFLRHNYIGAPHSIYKGIYKLLPGTTISLSLSEHHDRALPQAIPYWSALSAIEAGIAAPLLMSDAEGIEHLDNLLSHVVQSQMVADVPLGAFLSGGIDSSTVVALMQKQSSRPVKTFSIGFNESHYNEANHAKAVAQHLNTDHTELYVTSDQALDVIPKLSTLYDEPFSDSSQIPTFLVSQLAKQHVTVSLSGDGGDELFAGYSRYALAKSLWEKCGLLPPSLRSFIAKTLTAVPSNLFPKNLLNNSEESLNVAEKLHKLANVLAIPSSNAIYHHLVSHWKHPEQIVLHSLEPQTILSNNGETLKELLSFTQWMMYVDLVTYLPDDILAKVDRASMGVSLESRIPLLDHRVVEFAWRVPMTMKVRDGTSKWLLRQVLYKYVPQDLIDRPKKGFGVPLNRWLRGPLREWAEELLEERHLRSQGFFNPQLIRQKWQEHISGERNWDYYLWDILIFQDWLTNKEI